MPWPTISDPVPGTVITAAWEIANPLAAVRWLRQLMGNTDPPGSGSYVVVSSSATAASWAKVPSDALAAGAAVANIGYTPVNKAGDTAVGPLALVGDLSLPSNTASAQTVSAGAGGVSASGPVVGTTATLNQSQVQATNGSNQLGLAARVGAGAFNGIAQTNDLALLGAGASPGAVSLALMVWHTLAGGLGLRIDGPNAAVQVSGPVTGNARWNARASSATSSDTAANIVNRAQLAASVPLASQGGSGAPAVALVTEGASGLAFYEVAGEPWVANLGSGAKGRIWTSLFQGSGSGLSADNLRGYLPTTVPTASQIPVADASGKLDAWVTAPAPIPSGLIALWTTGSAPTGWTVYNGAAGRYLVAAGGSFGAVGGSGGTINHQHTMNHGHGTITSSGHSGSANQNNVATPNPANAPSPHTHDLSIPVTSGTTTGQTGVGDMPPWMTFTLVQKS
jgi:hypothetical protein